MIVCLQTLIKKRYLLIDQRILVSKTLAYNIPSWHVFCTTVTWKLRWIFDEIRTCFKFKDEQTLWCYHFCWWQFFNKIPVARQFEFTSLQIVRILVKRFLINLMRTGLNWPKSPVLYGFFQNIAQFPSQIYQNLVRYIVSLIVWLLSSFKLALFGI